MNFFANLNWTKQNFIKNVPTYMHVLYLKYVFATLCIMLHFIII